MKRFLICAVLAALVVPAASFAAGPTGQDRGNAARACRALRAELGLATFRQTYGTVQSNRMNAFGKCVSQWSRTEHQNRISARAACSAEQACGILRQRRLLYNAAHERLWIGHLPRQS
mgnify:CR=1 FL=1